jgi:hypothetical protein
MDVGWNRNTKIRRDICTYTYVLISVLKPSFVASSLKASYLNLAEIRVCRLSEKRDSQLKFGVSIGCVLALAWLARTSRSQNGGESNKCPSPAVHFSALALSENQIASLLRAD